MSLRSRGRPAQDLPDLPTRQAPPAWARRQLIDGIRFRVRTGVPWRDVPVEYGSWDRV
ncbi:transposase [Streptomyces sp. NPDC052020]|uniref:transposase n=1 Tax=Streptomyces sp. NPDC052020 TaxID=3155677 RepID=UPI00342E91A8